MTPDQILFEIELLLTPTVTLQQAARILGKAPRSVLNLYHAGKIGAFKPEGKGKATVYFDRDELERYKRQNRIKSNLEIESAAATFTFKKKAS